MRVSYFHPTCARKVLSFDAIFELMRRGHTEGADYQIGFHYPRECNECAGIIASDQGLITLERSLDVPPRPQR